MKNLFDWLREKKIERHQKRLCRESQEVRDDAVRRLTIREATMTGKDDSAIHGVAICLDGIVVGFIKDGEGDATKKLLELREFYYKTLGPVQQLILI